jgi:hypothetical protein
MSTRFTAVVVVGLILSHCGCATAQDSERIESWQSLEEKLSTEIEQKKATNLAFDEFSWKDLKTLAASQRIENAGLTVWREILRSGRTIPQIVAYHCVAEHDQRLKTEAALSFLFLTKQTPSVFRLTAAGEHLRELAPTQSNLDAFSIAMSQEFSSDDRIHVGYAVSEVPDAFLEAWVRQEGHVLVPLSNEAVVANRLLVRPRSPAEIRDLLERRLKDYAKVPGFPRVVYLLYSQDDDALLVAALKSILVDESISDLEFEIACKAQEELVRKVASELAGVAGETAARRIAVLRKRILR